MLKRLRTAHPILYCILSEVLFLGSMVVFSLLATIGLAAVGADFDTMDGYLFGSVQEAVGLAARLRLSEWAAGGHVPAVFHRVHSLWNVGFWPSGHAVAAAAPHPDLYTEHDPCGRS